MNPWESKITFKSGAKKSAAKKHLFYRENNSTGTKNTYFTERSNQPEPKTLILPRDRLDRGQKHLFYQKHLFKPYKTVLKPL